MRAHYKGMHIRGNTKHLFCFFFNSFSMSKVMIENISRFQSYVKFTLVCREPCSTKKQKYLSTESQPSHNKVNLMIEILFGFHFSIIISRVKKLLRRKKTILNIKPKKCFSVTRVARRSQTCTRKCCIYLTFQFSVIVQCDTTW